MREEDRTAIYIGVAGLASNAVAFALPQLWPHFPWVVSYAVLCIGGFLFFLCVFLLSNQHVFRVYLSNKTRHRLLLSTVLAAVLGGIVYWQTRPPETPLSLLEVYLTDFREHYVTVQDTLDLHSLEENWKVVSIVERKIFDFDANSYFHAVYIPKTQWTIKICKELATNYKELLRLPIKNFSRNNSGDISLTSEDNMVFTGMIYIYYNDDLSFYQLGDLYKTYEKMNLSVRFRGWEYLSHYIMEYERHNANEIKTFKKSYPNFTP